MNKLDIVLRLREARRFAGITQQQAADRSGINSKTISSWESGARAQGISVAELRKLLVVYEVSEEDFFGGKFDQRILGEADASHDGRGEDRDADDLDALVAIVRTFPRESRAQLIATLRAVVDVAERPCEHAGQARRIS